MRGGRGERETCSVRVDAGVLDDLTGSTFESDREPTRSGPSNRNGCKTLRRHVNKLGKLSEEICTCHVTREHTLVRQQPPKDW